MAVIKLTCCISSLTLLTMSLAVSRRYRGVEPSVRRNPSPAYHGRHHHRAGGLPPLRAPGGPHRPPHCPLELTQPRLLVRVRHCTLTSHTQRHSSHYRTHSCGWIYFWSTHSHCYMSVVHTEEGLFFSLSLTLTQKVTAGSQADTRVQSPSSFYVPHRFSVVFRFRLFPKFSIPSFILSCRLFLSLNGFRQGIGLSWTQSLKFYLAKQFLWVVTEVIIQGKPKKNPPQILSGITDFLFNFK